MIDIHTIQYNLHSEFHMLRHFESIDDGIQEKLLSNGYGVSQIQQALSLTGSKFFSHFANDIKELLEKILHYPYQKSTGINGNHIIETIIPYEEYPNGIGTKAVVSFDEISKEKQAQIFYEKNRGFPLAHLMVDELPVTNQCTLILKPSVDGYVFISAFSGVSAMPIPDEKMSKEIYEKCVDFWSTHVFFKNSI